MKFVILKLILSIFAITLCINLVSSLQNKSGLTTNLNLGFGAKVGMTMHMKSNYKMSLKNLLAKSHKKTESNNASRTNNKNTKNSKTSELNKLNSKILFRGWVKYFKFPDDDTQKKPKNFFKNPLYERDSKRKHAVGEVRNFY